MKYSQINKFEDFVKDDEFIFKIENAKDYLLTVVAELKKDLTDKFDKRIDQSDNRIDQSDEQIKKCFSSSSWSAFVCLILLKRR